MSTNGINLDERGYHKMDESSPTTGDPSKNSETYKQVLRDTFNNDESRYKEFVNEGLSYINKASIIAALGATVDMALVIVFICLTSEKVISMTFTIVGLLNCVMLLVNFLTALWAYTSAERDIYDPETNDALELIGFLLLSCVTLSFMAFSSSLGYTIHAYTSKKRSTKYVGLVIGHCVLSFCLMIVLGGTTKKSFARVDRGADAQGNPDKGIDFYNMPLQRDGKKLAHKKLGDKE